MKSTFKKLKKGKKSSSSSNSSSSSSTQQKNEKMFGGFITEQIHPFVLQSIEYMSEEDNVTQEGLFRVSGDVTHINRTKQMLNDDKEAMSRLTINEIAKNNVNNVAGLFKMYFREMAEPLLTFDHYDMFIAAHGVPDRETRIIVIKKVLRFLPRRNMQLLRTLCKFLHHVMQFASINKMTSSNLAIVFAPNLLRPKGDELVTMMSDSPHANGLMKTLIEEYELIFESGDDLEEEELRPAKGVGHRQQASHSSATGGSRSSNAHSSDDDDEDDSEEAEGDEEQDYQAPMRQQQQQQQQRVLPSTPSRPLTIVPPSKESTDTVHYPSPYAVTSPTRPLPLPSTPTMTRPEISSPVMESKPVPPPRKSAMIKQNVGGVNSVLPPPRWPPSASSSSSASASSSSSSSSSASQFRLAPQSLPTSPVTVDKRVLPTPPPQSPRGSRASLPVPRASGAFLVEVDQKLSHFNNDNHHADPVTLRTVEANPTKPLPPPRKPARN